MPGPIRRDRSEWGHARLYGHPDVGAKARISARLHLLLVEDILTLPGRSRGPDGSGLTFERDLTTDPQRNQSKVNYGRKCVSHNGLPSRQGFDRVLVVALVADWKRGGHMTDPRMLAPIDDLLAHPAETAWLEFKQDCAEPDIIGRLRLAHRAVHRIRDRARAGPAHRAPPRGLSVSTMSHLAWPCTDHGQTPLHA